jgi:signal peptidase I
VRIMTLRDLLFLIVALLVLIPIRLFVALPFVVSGESMLPTFETGNYIIVDQLTYHLREPERGEVVVFRYPNDETKFFIKRVIGLPGERVVVKDSRVTVYTDENPKGIELDEPYIFYTRDDETDVTLAEDQFFVLGDNRFSSSDSRIWGPLERDLILGRAFVRLYPLNTIDVLPGEAELPAN